LVTFQLWEKAIISKARIAGINGTHLLKGENGASMEDGGSGTRSGSYTGSANCFDNPTRFSVVSCSFLVAVLVEIRAMNTLKNKLRIPWEQGVEL
jgi:hypothetical protein